MGKKMYYTEDEAATKLGCSVDQLSQYVQEEKIRVFKDGLKNMYNAEEVDALAGDIGLAPGPGDLAPADDEDIVLTPADSSVDSEVEISLSTAGEETDIGMQEAGSPITLDASGSTSGLVDAVDLSTEAEDLSEGDKDDTALAAEGGSIFDTSDFEAEGADAMAQTQVSPSLEEQIAMEGVGSGSGLLDLTRESDDTSLGAEILEHIDADAEAAPELIEESIDDDLSGLAQPTPPSLIEPVVMEETDPSAGLFGGALVGAAVVGMVSAAMALAGLTGMQPDFLKWLNENGLLVVVASVAAIGIGGLLGFMLNKSAGRSASGRSGV
ncbi:MAG: helix-turn-helix domain-containing protein [Planctomycetota bacterium]|jgi:hypothetical protein